MFERMFQTSMFSKTISGLEYFVADITLDPLRLQVLGLDVVHDVKLNQDLQQPLNYNPARFWYSVKSGLSSVRNCTVYNGQVTSCEVPEIV